MERNWKCQSHNMYFEKYVTLQNVASWVVSIHAASNFSSNRTWCAWVAIGHGIYRIYYFSNVLSLASVSKCVVSIHAASNLSYTIDWSSNWMQHVSKRLILQRYATEYVMSNNILCKVIPNSRFDTLAWHTPPERCIVSHTYDSSNEVSKHRYSQRF